ncbi:heme ABC transporter permease CcmC [Acuticoccus sp. I52.16.1]|uniref:heme ABC transporter permease CcmC n=1 Tax=Acuticoccus sp. I52.16.1 TaxID=2928472 RepID=UPI001FD2F28B|nr:heme ABC transporter permease CcmC [Acuticoccus sp. I52.16.1]UOM33423.1 heme ABC transporter permease CcmC [Acuticoccus sp. I52.16.1]
MSVTSDTAGKRPSIINPGRFAGIADRAVPILAALTAVTLCFGLYLALWASPEDYQQGSTVRIMYIHAPSAYIALMAYVVMTSAALGTLVWRHPLADVAARAAAPIGAAFTLATLASGAIWGKPMWGAWWVWDARLTSMLILFFMYLGLIALSRAIEEPARAARITAIATLIGFINIPIIKFSVDWWNTLHQGASVMRLDGPSMPASMLTPLLVMALAFTLLFMTLHLAEMRTELLRRRARTLRLRAARNAG